jgi:hypothetical protein
MSVVSFEDEAYFGAQGKTILKRLKKNVRYTD